VRLLRELAAVGREVVQKNEIGTVESTRPQADIFSPDYRQVMRGEYPSLKPNRKINEDVMAGVAMQTSEH